MASKTKVPTDDWKKISEDDPKRLVKLVSEALKMRNERLSLEAEADVFGKVEREIKEMLINNFGKADLTEVKTKLGTAKLEGKNLPQIETPESWPKFYAHVAKTGSWDLLQKRLGERACQERWDAGDEIPGVKKFYKLDIKLGE